jgi:putative membrane protein
MRIFIARRAGGEKVEASPMNSLSQLLLRWGILAVGVWLATKLVSGIRYDDGGTLILVVLVLSLFNAVLKPLLVLFTLPFILLTLGLGMLVINALLFLFVGRLIEGFYVDSFWSALGGALIVSITNLVFGGFSRRAAPAQSPPANTSRKPVADKKDDVIDI